MREVKTDNIYVAALAAAVEISGQDGASPTAKERLQTTLEAYKAIILAMGLSANARAHEIDPAGLVQGETPGTRKPNTGVR